MEILFIHLPSPDTQVSRNFSLIRHVFSTIVNPDSHMSYRRFHTAWRKLFADVTALVVFFVFVEIGGQ